MGMIRLKFDIGLPIDRCERYFYTLADAIEHYTFLLKERVSPEMWVEEPNIICIKLD